MQPRWYQQEAIDSVFNYFASGKTGNPVIALPTGTGKSVVIAGLQKQALEMYPGQRFINLTHVKELVHQNSSRMLKMWPDAPMGVNSAGLKRRDTENDIIFAGIASVRNHIEAIGHRDLAIIDECHLVSPNSETMYGQVIQQLKDINPNIKTIGLTATKYRMGQGLLVDGDGLFTDTCYDLTDMKGFQTLLDEGFLAPLYPKKTALELDVAGVGVSRGDYNIGELQAAVDRPDVTRKALLELCEAGWDRRSWLIFAAGVDHANNIAEILNEMGVPTVAITGKTPNRANELDDFMRGKYRCAVSNNVMTTGFDYAPIDLIGMFRPSRSVPLWVQMLGRGTRPWVDGGYIDLFCGEKHWVSGGKSHCLVLDFAGNTKRLGPVNDPNIPSPRGKGGGDAPIRICEECGTYNHASATFCACCGEEFSAAEKIVSTSSDAELMRTEAPIIETYTVTQVMYHKHVKRGAANGEGISLRVDYYVGVRRFSEWVHFGKGGFMGRKAEQWWAQRSPEQKPSTVDQALVVASNLRVPKTIKVWVNKKFPEVLSYEY